MVPQILSPAGSIVEAILPLPATTSWMFVAINVAGSSVLNVVRVFVVAFLLVLALFVIAILMFTTLKDTC